MNALEIIQAAAVDIGIPRPNVAVAATDVITRQLVGLLNKEGRDLRRRYPWQAMRSEVTFAGVAAESQGTLGGLVPTMAYPVNETFWNRTTQQPVVGPVSPVEWQQLKAQVNSSPYTVYTIRGNEILMNPAPTAGHIFAFEYVRKTWCTDLAGAIYRNAVAVDTDIMLLDDEIMLLGLIWRWKAAKGFDFKVSKADQDREIADAIARDGTKPRLNLSAGYEMDSGVKTAIPRVIGL